MVLLRLSRFWLFGEACKQMAAPVTNSFSTFSPSLCRQYFASVLPTVRLNGRAQINVCCPFHDDKHASLSLNQDLGIWRCHSGCGSGGILDFAQKLANCDRETARVHVGNLLGISFSSRQLTPVAEY